MTTFHVLTRTNVTVFIALDVSTALDARKSLKADRVVRSDGLLITRPWSAPNEHVPDRADVDDMREVA